MIGGPSRGRGAPTRSLTNALEAIAIFVRGGLDESRFPFPRSLVPELFVNPHLPNYFVECGDVSSAATARSYIAEYEDAKVITFPNFRPKIDLDFWSGLDVDKYPSLKKYSFYLDGDDLCDARQQASGLASRGVDADLAEEIAQQFRDTLTALMPVYRSIFSDYVFDEGRKKIVWRLNTIMNENMHVDTYREETNDHFARMFVNLDNQPRIWHTSWPIDDMIRQLDGKIPAERLAGMTRGEVWSEINRSIFGKSSREWWDGQPRHVAYFQPGDVWIVDSRQVAHQIFYGRRALSIDFSLPKERMKNPDRHYLEIANRFMAAGTGKLASAPAA